VRRGRGKITVIFDIGFPGDSAFTGDVVHYSPGCHIIPFEIHGGFVLLFTGNGIRVKKYQAVPTGIRPAGE
jgi:hypothetical protein